VPIAAVKFTIDFTDQTIDSVQAAISKYREAIAAAIPGVVSSQVQIQILMLTDRRLRQRQKQSGHDRVAAQRMLATLATVSMYVTIQSASIDSAEGIHAAVKDITFVAALGTQLQVLGVDFSDIAMMEVDASTISSSIIATGLATSSVVGEPAVAIPRSEPVVESASVGLVLGASIGALVLLIAVVLLYRSKRSSGAGRIGLDDDLVDNSTFQKRTKKAKKNLDTRIFVDPGLDDSEPTISAMDSPANCLEQGELPELDDGRAEAIESTIESTSRVLLFDNDRGTSLPTSKSDAITRNGSLLIDGSMPPARPGSAKGRSTNATLDAASLTNLDTTPARTAHLKTVHLKAAPSKYTDKFTDSEFGMSDSGRETGFDTDREGIISDGTLSDGIISDGQGDHEGSSMVPALPQRMVSRRQSIEMAESGLVSLYPWVGKQVQVVSGKYKKREGIVEQVIIWAHNAHLPEVKVSFEGEKKLRRVLQRRLKLLEPVEHGNITPTAPLLGDDVKCSDGAHAGDRGHVVACTIKSPKKEVVAYYVRFEGESSGKSRTVLVKAKHLTVAPEMPTQLALENARRPRQQLVQPLPMLTQNLNTRGVSNGEIDFGLSDVEREITGVSRTSNTDLGLSDVERELNDWGGGESDLGLSDIERELDLEL
jgi:hypothetical protein